MKNVLAIFTADVKALSRQFFAMAIVIAIMFIPALYAWFNIFANWDPYGNTKNIKIAVASDDRGGTDLRGNHVNMGQTVMDQLAANENIDFVIYDDSDKALADTEAGKCYGAIILDPGFTENMYNLDSALSHPENSITFYENCKINAVGSKISETAAANVNQTVQTAYLDTVFDIIFTRLGDVVGGIDTEETENKVVDTLQRLRNTTAGISQVIDTFVGSGDEFAAKISMINTGDTTDRIDAANSGVEGTNGALIAARTKYETLLADANDEIEKLLDILNSGAADTGSLSLGAQYLLETGYALEPISPAYGEQYVELSGKILNEAGALASGDAPTQDLINAMRTDLNNLYALQNNEINAVVKAFFELLIDLTDNLSPVLESLSTTVSAIDPTMVAAADTIYALDDTLLYLKASMDSATESLDRLLEKAKDVRNNDILSTLETIFGGDPDEFAEFFACPVTVKTEVLYPVSDYGTAMTPFYSTLAIWVGCVVLAAILKVHASPRRLENVTENQLYWSRFILFLILNEIQTAVIAAGDLAILGVSCVNTGAFFLACAVTSFVFTALIYSLVISFGDVGKAIVVVIMVLQIAGSSGTYPIEILEPIFIKMYRLFPFPYAIDAMREALCGMYGADYWKFLAKLLIFGAAGILIGLFVRKPFIPMNEYVEEELEETGVF